MLYFWIKYISIYNEYVIKNLRKLYVKFSCVVHINYFAEKLGIKSFLFFFLSK